MSYNNHYSGALPNGSATGGSSRDRERDRDRPYHGRYPNQKYPNNYEPLNSSYRRDNRDYYGYRSNYLRAGGPQNGQAQNGSSRRKNGDKYDSYQGSKYRPPPKGKGNSGGDIHAGTSRNNSSGPNSSNIAASRGADTHDSASYYSGRKSYDGRNDNYGQSYGDNRRQARKNDWDSHTKRNLSRPRDQYKPDWRGRRILNSERLEREGLEHPLDRILERRASEKNFKYEKANEKPEKVERSENSDKSEKSEKHENLDASGNSEELDKSNEPEKAENEEKAERVETSYNSGKHDKSTNYDDPDNLDKSQHHAKSNKHNKSHVLEKIENSYQSDDAPKISDNTSENQSADTLVTTKVKTENVHSKDHKHDDSDTERKSKTPVTPSEKLLHLFSDTEDDPKEEEHAEESSKAEEPSKAEYTLKESIKEESSTSEVPNKTEELAEADADTSSPVQAPLVPDTSILSPVTASVSDARVMRELGVIDERSQPADDVSDAETVVTDMPVSMENAKKLLRGSTPDEKRRKLKRKVISSSDEEDEDEDENENTSEHSPEKSESHSEASSAENDDLAAKRPRRRDYKIKRDSTGRSLLQRACKKGDLEEVKKLILRGADANESDFGGFTCLHEAALAGHTEIAEYLIEHGANVNKQALEFGDFETPLMDAAENKHVDTVRLLLRHGADPDICNADGFSALTKLYHLEKDDDYDEIIEILDMASEKGGKQAVSHSPRKVVEDPTEGYFNDLVKKKSSAAIFKYLAQGQKESAAGDFVTHAYTLQKQPDLLAVAARNGHVELVDILLGLNPGTFNINKKNRVGVTVLLATVGRGHYDVVKFLLQKGADPRVKREQDGMNALQVAKHSAQHDPREVMLLEQYMLDEGGEHDLERKRKGLEDGRKHKKRREEMKKEKEKDERLMEKKVEKVRKESVKESVDERRHIDDERVAKSKSAPPSKSATPEHRKGPLKDVLSDVKHSSKETFKNPFKDSSKKEHTPDKMSVSPASSKAQEEQSKAQEEQFKAQEEQRLRAAEEAKVWQEKVESKKRARREMFLQAEKEREKKRREDEQRRLQERQQQKELELEEQAREAQEAKRLAHEMERKRALMELHAILRKYPVGLREAVFDGTISDKERMRFCPLYVFHRGGEKWVVDLQVALLVAAPVSDIHKHCDMAVAVDVAMDSKAALWHLFYYMVGVTRNGLVEHDGLSKFRQLQMRYLRLSDVALFVREFYPEVEELVWRCDRLTNVLLDMAKQVQADLPAKTDANEFVPPKFKHRRDILRTIQSAHTPLW